jgi:hypothetical protein
MVESILSINALLKGLWKESHFIQKKRRRRRVTISDTFPLLVTDKVSGISVCTRYSTPKRNICGELSKGLSKFKINKILNVWK